jgi:hypothetical protein
LRKEYSKIKEKLDKGNEPHKEDDDSDDSEVIYRIFI